MVSIVFGIVGDRFGAIILTVARTWEFAKLAQTIVQVLSVQCIPRHARLCARAGVAEPGYLPGIH
ncbi:MAG: hypothetical protein C4318_03725 [Acidimicrobiia bacterium]